MNEQSVICCFCGIANTALKAEVTFKNGKHAICSLCIENAALQLVARREKNRRALEEIRRLGT